MWKVGKSILPKQSFPRYATDIMKELRFRSAYLASYCTYLITPKDETRAAKLKQR
ncbi:hypothetical protein CEXT_449281, partial [Caerostris extrusa]